MLSVRSRRLLSTRLFAAPSLATSSRAIRAVEYCDRQAQERRAGGISGDDKR